MILGCLILVMIVVASSNKAESVAGLDEPEGDGRRSRGLFTGGQNIYCGFMVQVISSGLLGIITRGCKQPG